MFILDNGYTLQVLPHNVRTRIVVFRYGAEAACRIEVTGKLRRYAAEGEGVLFKGRLQLHRRENYIDVLVKGIPVGQIPVSSFAALV